MEIKVQAGVPETPEAFVARRDLEIAEWLADKATLDLAKEQERLKREKVSATLFATPKRGTNRYPLNNGYALKLVHGLTYTLGNKDLADDDGEAIPIAKQVEALEEKIAAIGNTGNLLVKRLIKWTPSLIDSAYRELDKDSEDEMQAKAIIDEILTVKPAAPQLTFEEPKVK